MKKLAYMLLAAAGLAACGDDSEVFYTISYPIVRVAAEVTVSDTATDPTPESGGGTEESTAAGSATALTNDAEIERLEAEIAAEAPVQAGGGYTLYFSKYDSGRTRIDTAGEAGSLTGAFVKEPGSDRIRFFLPPERLYTCTLHTYTDEQGVARILLQADLTEEYRLRYPTAGIDRAVRLEYTSTAAY